MNKFTDDPYPEKTKILFIGHGSSSHTIAWIDSIKKANLNARIFCLPGTYPPVDWWGRAYIIVPTDQMPEKYNDSRWESLYPTLDESQKKINFITKKKFLHPFGWAIGALKFVLRVLKKPSSILQMDWANFFEDNTTIKNTPSSWLAEIIREWRPDIIHTLGMDPAGFFYLQARTEFNLQGIGKWVLQLRGGSDLTLSRFDPDLLPKIKNLVNIPDQIISDNIINFNYLHDLGFDPAKIAPISPIPGTGGIDVNTLASAWEGKPSQRRIIIWPKAYDCEWSVALPVFEAIKIAWDHIQPCTIYLLAMDTAGTKKWYNSLPKEIQKNCRVYNRIPRIDLLSILPRARVMLAPSLVDGIPNSLYEAMSAGAFPIVSPLETIKTVVQNEKNVLFARNLYPQEIADALIRAMNDDNLIDMATHNNLSYVRRLADRSILGPKIIAYYENLMFQTKSD